MGKIKKGFTFIEMLTVIGAIGLVLPALIAIIFSILKQQTKIISISDVKKQGDYVLLTMTKMIRTNAISIHSSSPPTDANEICKEVTSSSLNAPYFKEGSGGWFDFYTSLSGSIYGITFDEFNSSGARINNSNLLTSKVRVHAPPPLLIPSFSIKCSRSDPYSPPIISIQFTVEYNTSSVNPEENASLDYRTNTKMTNY